VSDTKEKIGGLPFVFAGLAFIPLIGVAFGIVVIIMGLAAKKRGGLKVAPIGGIGICFTMVLNGGLFYFGFVRRGGIYDELRGELAQSSG
jgi:hypothetical protein